LPAVNENSSPPAIRASDAERRQVIHVLRDAVVEGRLTLEEYSDRVGIAVGARTDVELAELTRDLPVAAPSRALATDAPRPRFRAICSHLVRRGPLRLPRQASYLSVFGTIDLDLRQATLPGPEIDLQVTNVFGTVTVIVPDGVHVEIDGGGLLASEKVDISALSALPEAPVVRIHTSGPGGTLYVRSAED